MPDTPIKVPTDDPNSSKAPDQRYEALEKRIVDLERIIEGNSLSGEAKLRDLLISEIKQRLNIRRFSVVLGLTVIVGMSSLLGHVLHNAFLSWPHPFLKFPSSFSIAIFVAPVVSITTITVMLFIGAFRRFKDGDLDNVNVASLASEGAKTFGGM